MRALIGILSCHRDNEQDAICQQTWLNQRLPAADYRFFRGVPIGLPLPDSHVTLNVGDDYNSLPFKTQAMCRWALLKGYDYLFKCDNDTYVHIPRLMASGFERHAYSGWNWGGTGGYCSGGAGYWLDRKCMGIIGDAEITADWRHPEHGGSMNGEDLQVGAILHRHGIDPFDDPRYRIRAPWNPDTISLHDVVLPAKGEDMKKLHRLVVA